MRKTPPATLTTTADSVPPTKPPAGNPAGSPRVLIVIANHHFFYREYADPKAELEKAGIKVTIAFGRKSVCDPHQNSGEGSDGGRVRPDIALADAKADDFDAIVFSGGWGSSMYQYAFRGNYADRAYNGDRTSKEAANRLINDFIRQDKYVGGICHGVSVLAWARVNDSSPLTGKRVVAPQINGPAGVYNGQQAQPPSRWNAEQNGAQLAPARSVGSPSPEDDVMVDGKILTAEDDHAARHFGNCCSHRYDMLQIVGVTGKCPQCTLNCDSGGTACRSGKLCRVSDWKLILSLPLPERPPLLCDVAGQVSHGCATQAGCASLCHPWPAL
jgi:putative intracellular protease/amidase